MKPFLTNLAIKRESGPIDFELRYNDELDMNEVVSSVAQNLLTKTTTRHQPEAPDTLNLWHDPSSIDYLATKTVTEVRPEKPDVSGFDDLSDYLQAATATKTASEGRDFH